MPENNDIIAYGKRINLILFILKEQRSAIFFLKKKLEVGFWQKDWFLLVLIICRYVYLHVSAGAHVGQKNQILWNWSYRLL